MKYAIELYFDAETERKLEAPVQRVADAGISGAFSAWKSRPHLTLACFNDVEEACAGLRKRQGGLFLLGW